MSKARDIVKGTATSLAGGVTGAVPYQSNTGATAMTAAGTTGQILTTVTTGANPTWQTPAGGGASALTISNKTAAYTVVAGDNGTILNWTSGTFTATLTAAATLDTGFNVWIWNTGTGVVTIDTNATETIDGIDPVLLFKLTQGSGIRLVCNGTGWYTTDVRMSGSAAVGVGAVQLGRNSTGLNSIATALGSVALGGSLASGTDTFATSIQNNTSPYGASGVSAVAIGKNARATGNSTAVAIGANCVASGNGSTAIGYGTTAGGGSNGAVAVGNSCNASGETSFAFGYACTTSATCQTAIGNSSGGGGSVAATGAGAMALGGSYASGASSFAAAIQNNTSSYGAQGTNSIAMGFRATASGHYSVAISTGSSSEKGVASGSGSMILGQGVASGGASLCLGTSVFAANTNKTAMSGVTYSNTGQAEGQLGMMSIWAVTTNATPVQLQTSNSLLQAINLPTLYNNSAVYFKGTVVARQKALDGTASAAWTIEGLIRKEATVGSTTMVTSTVTAVSNVPAWTIAVSADTTFGAINVTFTGAAATNIRVLCILQMTELNNYA